MSVFRTFAHWSRAKSSTVAAVGLALALATFAVPALAAEQNMAPRITHAQRQAAAEARKEKILRELAARQAETQQKQQANPARSQTQPGPTQPSNRTGK